MTLANPQHPVLSTTNGSTGDDLESLGLPLPIIDKDDKTHLWAASVLNRGRLPLSYSIVQSLLFVASNIVVNWYSIDGNLNGRLPTSLVITINSIGAVSTLISNTLSKLIEIPHPADALFLDASRFGFINFFIINGPERTFYENLKSILQLSTIFSGKKYIYIDTRIQKKIGNRFDSIIKLIRSEFGKDDNHNLMIFSEDSIIQSFSGIEKNSILLACHLSPELRNRFNKQNIKIIDFYANGFFGRIVDEFLQCRPISALWTAIKAVLASLRWTMTKGIPAIVVIFTIVHALSEVEQIKKSDSRIVHGIALIINFLVAWIGKMLVNNTLKGGEFDREVIKLIHRITHRCSITLHWKAFIFTLFVTLFTFFPYFGVTSFLYTVNGMITVFNEFNFVAHTHITLPHWLNNAITGNAVVTALGLAWATGSNPIYRALIETLKKNNGDKKIVSDQHKEIDQATQAHPWINRCFIVTTLVDSALWANNAWFNFDKSWIILSTIAAGFATFSHHAPWAQYVGSGLVALGILIYAMAWALYKGKEKFPHSMRLWGELRQGMDHKKGYVPIKDDVSNEYFTTSGHMTASSPPQHKFSFRCC